MTIREIFANKDTEIFRSVGIDPNISVADLSEEQIKELEKQYMLSAQKGLDISKSSNIDDYFEQIKELIDSGELKDKDKLIKYINEINMSDQMKNDLITKSCEYLNTLSLDNQITQFRDKIIDYLRKPRKEGTQMIADFEVKSNAVGEQLCSFKLSGVMNNVQRPLEQYTFYYTDELKKELIEPIIEEISLKDPVVTNDFVQSTASFGYRSDYFVATSTNACVNLNNIEQPYAEFLKKRVNNISNISKISDPNMRDAMINNLKEEREIDNVNELEKPMVRELKKNDNQGFVSIYYILAALATLISIVTIVYVIIKH